MKDTMKHTGGYVVIHHGADGKQEQPLYLVNPYIPNAMPHHYTGSLARADIFSNYLEASGAARNENAYLKQEGHPLAGHIEVGELFCRDYEPKGDEQ